MSIDGTLLQIRTDRVMGLLRKLTMGCSNGRSVSEDDYYSNACICPKWYVVTECSICPE